MNKELMSLSNHFKKYNLGCGDHLYTNFLNIGFWNQLEDGQVYRDLNGTSNTFMLNHDLRNGVPADDGALELVYHSHMLEHLSYTDGIKFTQECHRVLKPGGSLRVLVPDLELWINAYNRNDRFFFEEYQKCCLDSNIFVTNASIFMGMLHNHGHRSGYDYETLAWVLRYCGFTNIRRTLYGSSRIEDVKVLELLDPIRIMETLCVECEKPV